MYFETPANNLHDLFLDEREFYEFPYRDEMKAAITREEELVDSIFLKTVDFDA